MKLFNSVTAEYNELLPIKKSVPPMMGNEVYHVPYINRLEF